MNKSIRKLNILYCHGLGSSINNRHGLQLKKYFENYDENVYFERFVYKNPGSVDHVWNVNEWKSDIEKRIGTEPWILIATSGACHAALNIAKSKPNIVKGLMLLCPGTSLDFDFVDTIAPGALQKLIKDGSLIYPPSRNGYPALLNYASLKEFLDTCITREPGSISINCPVLICHGTEDNLVPYKNSVRLLERLTAKNKKLVTIKGANHYFDIDETVQKHIDTFIKDVSLTSKL